MDSHLIKAGINQQSLATSIIDSKAVSSLLPGERRIVEAALQPKIGDLPPVDVITTFIAIVTQAYTRAGYKMPDENTLAIYADEFFQCLLEKFPMVSISEVREALKEGVYGEYGEFTGLNPKTFMQFIRGYVSSTTRKEAIKLFESKREYLNSQFDLSPEEREAVNKSFVNALYEDHMAGKLLSDYIPAFIFDFLEKQGKIALTREEKIGVKDRAKSYLTRLKVSERYKGKTRSIGDELSSLVRKKDEEGSVKIISKQFAVVDYFEAQSKAGAETIFISPKLLQ